MPLVYNAALISNIGDCLRVLKINTHTALDTVVDLFALRNSHCGGLVVVRSGCFGIGAFEFVGIIIGINFHRYCVGKADLIAECKKRRGSAVNCEIQVVIGIVIVSGFVVLDSN